MDLFCPLQSTSCTALEMPTSAKVLQVILEYIYTDDSPTIRGIILILSTDFNHYYGYGSNCEVCVCAESLSVEFACSVLVVADQLLITRLKEICEVAITENRECFFFILFFLS